MPEAWKLADPSRTYYLSISVCPRCGEEWQRIRDAVDNRDAAQDAVVDCCPYCGFDEFNIWPRSTRRYRGP